jgi:hypothetical protein
MTERIQFRLKCDSIDYRQGFIEVIPAIHDGCINIETWQIDPHTNLSNAKWVDDISILDSSSIANTELELTATQARNLAAALLVAAESLDGKCPSYSADEH